jgi:hypothetical protein
MKIFDSVAQMKLATIKAGQYVETFGYYAKGDAGAARYLVVASQAADGYGDHVLVNGTVAVLQITDGVTLKQLGCKGDGTDQTAALVNAMALGLKIDTGARTDNYYLVGATLLSLTSLNYVPIASYTKLVGGGTFTILSNQIADGTRYELKDTTEVYIGPVKFSEVNATLTRSTVYAPICGNNSTRFLFDRTEVDGANGAAMHFRINCNNFVLNQPKIRNAKADGMNIQRGSREFVINEPDIQLVEDDCIGVVGHGRNEGYDRAGFGAIYCGKVMGNHANGAVGAAIALVGCTDMDVYNLRSVNTGGSAVRINAFVDPTEGEYTAQNIRVINPVCTSSGITTDPSGGILKDGISIGNASNVRIINPICTLSVNHGITVSDSCVDVKIANPKCFRNGVRGIWVSVASQSSAWAMELWQDDPRKGAATTVENHFLSISDVEIDYSGTDGFYADGGVSGWLKSPIFTNLKVNRSNIGDVSGKYGIFAKGLQSPVINGYSGGESGTGAAITPFVFVTPLTDYLITGGDTRISSKTIPFETVAGKRKFWSSSQPTTTIGLDGGYVVGDEVYNSNPASGTKLWTCTVAGDPGTWFAHSLT